MHGLTLREEFRGDLLEGTQIVLRKENGGGALDRPAEEFLRITYPTNDVISALEAIGPDTRRPVVLVGERGQGKSHLVAVLHHALHDRTGAVRQWLAHWARRFNRPALAELPLRAPLAVISEELQRANYRTLWDLLFDKHPQGRDIQAKWESKGHQKANVPSFDLLVEMFRTTPTALILDEFETWFDGLKNTAGSPERAWAFNFIQNLGRIAQDHPDIFCLVVTVRSGRGDAFQQLHRDNPVIVDFKGPDARHDRQRLLLHRLFENRLDFADEKVASLVEAHADEYIRLKKTATTEQDAVRRRFVEAWPFAFHLMDLLEDQVLTAVTSQETRDLIRVLASIFKRRGEHHPILTSADVGLDDDRGGIVAQFSAASSSQNVRLREKALRNLQQVRESLPDHERTLPYLDDLIASLWLRSLAMQGGGADRATLQVDVTRAKPIDDNEFSASWAQIVENSFNIHEHNGRYAFKEEENPEARVMACARNDRLFQNGEDLEHLAREVAVVLGNDDNAAKRTRVTVLRSAWRHTPWKEMPATERLDVEPAAQDLRTILVVVPEPVTPRDATLGPWLASHLTKRRNMVRFLVPRDGTPSIYADDTLVRRARAVLKAEEFGKDERRYLPLAKRYQQELRELLTTRFDQFVVLYKWNFQQPDLCVFSALPHKAKGDQIPAAVEKRIQEDLFAPEEFEKLVTALAAEQGSVSKLLAELQEPRPKGEPCVPWLGEADVKDRLTRLCARGIVAIDLRGTELLQQKPGESEDDAWKRMKGRIESGRFLEETILHEPQPIGTAPPVEVHKVVAVEPTEVPTIFIANPPPVSPEVPPLVPTAPPLVPTIPVLELKPAPTSRAALNWLTELDAAKVSTTTSLESATLTLENIDGQDLRKVLRLLLKDFPSKKIALTWKLKG